MAAWFDIMGVSHGVFHLIGWAPNKLLWIGALFDGVSIVTNLMFNLYNKFNYGTTLWLRSRHLTSNTNCAT